MYISTWFENLPLGAVLVFPGSMFYTIYSITSNRMTIIGLCAFKSNTTFNNGSLGSRIDEERSEMR